MYTKGGSGSTGYIRGEHPGAPTPAELGTTQPPATAITRAAHRSGSGRRHGFPVASDRIGLPAELRALRGLGDGQPAHRCCTVDDVAYVDPSVPPRPNRGLAADGQAVRFLVQGADVAANGTVNDVLTIQPWRRLVGSFGATELSLDSDSRTGFRFLLLFDRAVADAVVTKVVLFYKN